MGVCPYICVHLCTCVNSDLHTLPAELSSPPIFKKILYVKDEHLYFSLHRQLPLDAGATLVVVEKAP